MQEAIIRVRNLQRRFPVKENSFGRAREFVHAVNGVDLDLTRGKTVGLVGESGCGKTTIGRLIVGLDNPDCGEIFLNGAPVTNMPGREARDYHKKVQIIFQNPYGALNPRQRIYQTFEEALKVHRIVSRRERAAEVERLLETVGISPDYKYHYPFEFSGGQRQRLCIARALAVHPEVVVCDEPVSALDVSVQSQILKLLKRLQTEFDLTYLFISHDLSVVYHVCDYIYIMYLGKIVEQGPVEEIFNSPKHPYNQALINAVPVPDPNTRRKRIILKGEVPNPVHLPEGCPFHTRCPEKMPVCSQTAPQQITFAESHRAACWLYKEDQIK